MRLLLKGLVLAAVASACTKEGRSLVPVNIELAPSLAPPARVRVTVSSAASGKSWPIEDTWAGPVLHVGVFLPADVRGDVTTEACGFDGAGKAIASGLGNTVSVTPGQEAALVAITLDGSGSDFAGCSIVAGGAGGTGGVAGTGGAGGNSGTAGAGGTGMGGMAGTAGAGGGGTGGAGGGGILEIAFGSHQTSINLTDQGTIDWAHWGTMGDFFSFDHRDLGQSRPIKDVTTTAIRGYAAGDSFTWSNGYPTASATDLIGGFYMSFAGPSIPESISWTIEAATTTRRLRLFIGADNVTTLTVSLSDGSAPAQMLSFSTDTMPVEITFRATSTAATLSAIWKFSPALTNTDAGHMFVSAATLFDAPN